jgi:spermidine/putrescine transport system permease protein
MRWTTPTSIRKTPKRARRPRRAAKMKNKALAAPYLVWMALFTIVPLAIVAYYAFTDAATGEFTFANIANLGNYMPILIKSIWLALISSLICIVIGYPVAYFIANCKETTQRFLYMLVMLPMCISFLLRTLAWVALTEDTGIINNFITAIGLQPLPLIRNNGAVVLGMVYNYLPYMIMPLYTVIMKIDRRLIEAAQDLGCNGVNVFKRVILPLSVPGIISGFTMVFVPAVSTFYISQKLGSSGTTLIGDVIESQFKTAYNPNLGAALSLILMVMIFICIGVMNRFGDEEEEVVTL